MTTVTAGNTGTYTFTATQTVTVTLDSNERARVTVTRAGATVFSTVLSSPQTIGPFLAADVMTITAVGAAIDYTVTGYQSQTQGTAGAGMGLLSDIPTASASNVGYIYVATDGTYGATAYMSNGVSFVQMAAGVGIAAGLSTTLWADRGTATLGLIKIMTDYSAVSGGNPNVMIIGDGTRWQPLGGAQTLFALAAPITGTAGASSACTLPSLTLPAGLLGINGGLEIILHTHTVSGTVPVANTISYTFDGFELFGNDNTTSRRLWFSRVLMNRNSAAVQTVMSNASGSGAYIATTNDPKETTKDTTAAIAMAGSATATHATSIQNRVDEFRVRWLGG